MAGYGYISVSLLVKRETKDREQVVFVLLHCVGILLVREETKCCMVLVLVGQY